MALSEIEGITLSVAEPHISALPDQLGVRTNIELTDAETAIRTADVVLLLVDHDQFLNIPSQVDLTNVTVIDTRGQWA